MTSKRLRDMDEEEIKEVENNLSKELEDTDEYDEIRVTFIDEEDES